MTKEHDFLGIDYLIGIFIACIAYFFWTKPTAEQMPGFLLICITGSAMATLGFAAIWYYNKVDIDPELLKMPPKVKR